MRSLRGLATLAFFTVAGAAGVVAAACAGDALPTVSYASFDAVFGNVVRIGWYGVTHKDCSLERLPRIEVLELPKSGELTIEPGQVLTASTAPCPNLKIPALILLYSVRYGASGEDHVSYRVTTESGRISAYDVSIHIAGSSAMPTKPGNSL